MTHLSGADADDPELATALTRIPLLAALDRREIAVSSLPGLTNRTLRLDTAIGRFVLRIPGRGTSALIDRDAEAHAARFATSVGLNVPILHLDPADGLLLMPFQDGFATPTGADIICDPRLLASVATILSRLHSADVLFRWRFVASEVVALQWRGIEGGDLQPPTAALALREEMAAFVAGIERRGRSEAPCHNDPGPYNLLDDSRRLFLIDWEYAGMNDPFWDLAAFSVEAGLDEAGETRLLAAYGRAGEEERARLAEQKILCHWIAGLWGLAQAARGVPDMEAYGTLRVGRCRDALGSAAARIQA